LRRFVFWVVAGFVLFSLGHTKTASAASGTMYTWTPSKLYKSSTGTAYYKKINSGTAVAAYGKSNSRYKVKVGGKTGYIQAYNLTAALTKKTVYLSSKLYTTSSHTKYTSVIAVNQKVYVKESANGMYHVHVIGTNKNGWIYKSHFTKPSATSNSGTTSQTQPLSSETTSTQTTTTGGTTSETQTVSTSSTSSATLKGLDVSHYQSLTQSSFNKMKSEGYSFVIIKATEGTTYTDPEFYTYYKYARNAGLSVHAYHMIGNSTTTASQHIAEAKHFYNVLSQTKAKTGYVFTGYAFEDVEETTSNGITATWWKNSAPVCIGYFLNEMKTLGQTKVGLYADYYDWTTYLENNTGFWPSDTKIWLARYNVTLGTEADVWQYTSTGTIDGIDGYVDLDISYDSDF